MKRREFMMLLGGAVAWPLLLRAQQAAMPVIGYLATGSQEAFASRLAAFRQGLAEHGFAEGRNVAFEYRWALGEFTEFRIVLPRRSASFTKSAEPL